MVTYCTRSSEFRRNQLTVLDGSAKIIKETQVCFGSLRDNVLVHLFLYPCQVYCELNLQREAGLYYSNKLPRMRRALVRA